jgi:hypothetical protein
MRYFLNCEIVSLLDKKLARWSCASCVSINIYIYIYIHTHTHEILMLHYWQVHHGLTQIYAWLTHYSQHQSILWINRVWRRIWCPGAYWGPLHTRANEPWSCNHEGPWLSSTCCTMRIGKSIFCSHGSLSIMWSENGYVEGPLHILLVERGILTLVVTYVHSISFRFFCVSHWKGRKEEHDGSS